MLNSKFCQWLEIIQHLFRRIRNLVTNSRSSIQYAQPGELLDDGCVVIERYPKTPFHKERVLIAAPKETEVWCDRSYKCNEVFDSLEANGFNPSEWFIPAKIHLVIAYFRANKHFPNFTIKGYWYSTDNPFMFEILDYFCVYDPAKKDRKGWEKPVRAFRLVEL
jgi:hypothetical protein